MKRIFIFLFCLIIVSLSVFINGCFASNKNRSIYEQYLDYKAYFELSMDTYVSRSHEFVFLNKANLSNDEYEHYKNYYKISDFEELVLAKSADDYVIILCKGNNLILEGKLDQTQNRMYVQYKDYVIYDYKWVYRFLGEFEESDGQFFANDKTTIVGVNERKVRNRVLNISTNVINIAGMGLFDLPAEEVVCNLELKRIGPNAFATARIKRIKLNDGLFEIGALAFDSCENLKEIVIPKSVEIIGKQAFTDTIVYCEVESKPEGWANDFAANKVKVYYANEWHYDDAGNPVPNS